MSFHLDPIWSYPLVVLAIAGLLALVLVTYPPRVRHLPVPWRRGLLGLRLATAVVLGLAMLRPEIQHEERDEKQRVMLILTDVSRSMTTRDAPGGLSRRDALIKTLGDAGDLLSELGEKIEIRYYDFSDSLTPVETLSPEAKGPQTAMGAALDQALKETSREQLVGMLMLGDGAQRRCRLWKSRPGRWLRGSATTPRTACRSPRSCSAARNSKARSISRWKMSSSLPNPSSKPRSR